MADQHAQSVGLAAPYSGVWRQEGVFYSQPLCSICASNAAMSATTATTKRLPRCQRKWRTECPSAIHLPTSYASMPVGLKESPLALQLLVDNISLHQLLAVVIL